MTIPTEVWVGIAALVSTLWGATLALAKMLYTLKDKQCADCCTERDRHRLANEEALAAFRRAEEEERKLRRLERETGRGRPAP